MTWTFTVIGRTATVNELLRGRWYAARLKKRDKALVALACHRDDVPAATGKRRVSVHLVLGPRQRGPDSDSIFKSLLDALTACGRLIDDRKECCELGAVTYSRGDRAEMRVVLTDLGGGAKDGE